MSHALQTLRHRINFVNSNNLEVLGEIYSETVTFKDPFHELQGLAALKEYFARLYKGVASCGFEFTGEWSSADSGVLLWVMTLRHQTFRPDETLRLEGASHLRFGDKITFQQDYYDAGAMIYERVPMLGGLVRMIKSRL